MLHNHEDLKSYRQKNQELEQKINQLNELRKQKLKERHEVHKEMVEKQYYFNQVQKFRTFISTSIRKVMKVCRTLVGGLLGRRDLRQLYSRTYKQKFEQNKLKKYQKYLYEYGFESTVLFELEQMYHNPRNKYHKRAVAEMLLLWHANQLTVEDSHKALTYLKELSHKETNREQLRKLSIIEAECLQRLGYAHQARNVINEALKLGDHPDLYFALTNLEEDQDKKEQFINKAFEMYQLSPIKFNQALHDQLYDQLDTILQGKQTTDSDVKVTVILPAYNAEDGIATAIESILNQTWKNLELIIVDDHSQDDTLFVAKRYEEQDERVKVLQTPQNSGPYVARNIALAEARGDLITVNDADDWSHAEKIGIQAQHLIDHPEVIANTSEHARLTEELTFYRRGLFGRYIFSNMSSLMFRKDEVLNSIGYWDEVRFAGDGEFKRRLLNTFGKERIVDLETGPLSLPRQAAGSLTSSSAFGYDGHFKGARKEYVESFEYYHEYGESLKYPISPTSRLFPVPEPMLPNKNRSKTRQFDIIIAADFRQLNESVIHNIRSLKQMEFKVGLAQISEYNFNLPYRMADVYRQLIDGEQLQVVVFGEQIECELLLVYDLSILYEDQRYIPSIKPSSVKMIVTKLRSDKKQPIRVSSHRLIQYFGHKGKWYPINDSVRGQLKERHLRELKNIKLSIHNWNHLMKNHDSFKEFIDCHLLSKKGDVTNE